MGIKLCVTNKYFIMFFMLAVFLSFYEAVTGTCNAYYAQYILGNRDLLGALASFESIPQIVTVLVLSPFIAKFGKRNVALIGAVVAVVGTVSLFINPSALNLALFACVMRGIGKGCFRGVKYSMLADVIEYGAWKSGIRVQGLMVSATTAGQKFGSGMTSAIFGALMSLVGFAGTVTINAAQSQMLIGIYMTLTNHLFLPLYGNSRRSHVFCRLPLITHDPIPAHNKLERRVTNKWKLCPMKTVSPSAIWYRRSVSSR